MVLNVISIESDEKKKETPLDGFGADGDHPEDPPEDRPEDHPLFAWAIKALTFERGESSPSKNKGWEANDCAKQISVSAKF